jgi:DNA modification methylase
MVDRIQRVKLPAPPGRVMLRWRNKHALRRVDALPLRLAEEYSGLSAVRDERPNPSRSNDTGNLLFHGDNRGMLAYLIANGYRGKVKLIYIDPPFDTGGDFSRKVTLRGKGSHREVQHKPGDLGRQLQYEDTWADDSYLQFMYERLQLMRELLCDEGSIWLHCDYRRVHYLRLLLEEVFGAENYLNTISWRSQTVRGAKAHAFFYANSTQYIEIFGRNRSAPTTWNVARKQTALSKAEADAEYMSDEQGYFRTSDPGTYSYERLKLLYGQGRLYAPFGGTVICDDASQRVYASNGGSIAVKYYLKPLGGDRYAIERSIDNLWDDIPGLGTTPGEDLGYPTQKTEALLARVIAAASNPGDTVLDCFAGSGTTPAVAQQMGRRWIACDANYVSIQTITRRLHHVLQHGASAESIHPPQISRSFGVFSDVPAQPEAVEAECHADVTIMRDKEAGSRIRVVINSYASNAINARWRETARSEQPQQAAVSDWRAVVDSVMIDPAYDGGVFRPALIDAPYPRTTLVSGTYELDAAPELTTVVVKLTDILGHDVLVSKKV